MALQITDQKKNPLT